ncbi:MAG: malto-oligosyltrehalose trehalohydrolase [Chloroflexota bacterium]
MTAFRVWAPVAQSVTLNLDGERYQMTAAARGWWSLNLPNCDPVASYAFILDDTEPLPDPRSHSQPEGVRGHSRLVFHEQFAWTDSTWQPPAFSSAIVYEMHVGTFTPLGTFDSAIERLDHLVDLGVTHLELMPIAEFPGTRGWGYDGVDLYAPHHAYGGPDGLKRLVNACHARGLAVILDVVYNHLGPDGNYLGRFGPYFTNHYSTPWGQAVNIDGAECDEVRRFFIDNALMWLRDYHFDGLRLDAVHEIIDTSAVHFLEQLASEVDSLAQQIGRPLTLIAETDRNDPRLLWSRDNGGYGLTAQWNDDFHHALHAVLTGERDGYYADFGSLEHLARALQHAYVFEGQYSSYRRRFQGRPTHGLALHRFLGFLQNHDQIGNRARGDRGTHLMSTGRLKIGAALVLMSALVPMLFQGEEWGASSVFQYFTDHEDPELALAVTAGRRAEFAAFGWKSLDVPDPQVVETFEQSKLNWEERLQQPHADLLSWHRQLIRIRNESFGGNDGRLDQTQVTFDERAQWLVVERGAAAVACNLSSESQRVPLPSPRNHELLLASHRDIVVDEGAVLLPKDAVIVVHLG